MSREGIRQRKGKNAEEYDNLITHVLNDLKVKRAEFRAMRVLYVVVAIPGSERPYIRTHLTNHGFVSRVLQKGDSRISDVKRVPEKIAP